MLLDEIGKAVFALLLIGAYVGLWAVVYGLCEDIDNLKDEEDDTRPTP